MNTHWTCGTRISSSFSSQSQENKQTGCPKINHSQSTAHKTLVYWVYKQKLLHHVTAHGKEVQWTFYCEFFKFKENGIFFMLKVYLQTKSVTLWLPEPGNRHRPKARSLASNNTLHWLKLRGGFTSTIPVVVYENKKRYGLYFLPITQWRV